MAGPTFPHPYRLAALAIAMLAMLNSAGAQQSAPAPIPAKKAPAAQATPVVEKPLWKDLSAPQRVALAPLAGEWDRMEGTRKQKWLDIANRYAAMKPHEQERVQVNMREWIKLTPEERRMARENYTLTKKIDKSKKADSWNEYQQLSEEQKKKLAADATIAKKQVTNLPPKTQAKPVAPIKPGVAPAAGVPCPAGTVKNAAAATPACVPAALPPAAAAPAPSAVPAAPAATSVPAVAPAAVPPNTPPPGSPATPVPNAK